MKIYCQNIGIEFGIEKCHANNEKRRNKTIKSRKTQNARRKINLKILGNIGSGHYQTSGDERKKLQKSISRERESYSKPNYIAQASSNG